MSTIGESPHIVMLSKVLPYTGIAHAGGEFVRRHVSTLQELGYRVTVIAPRDRRNIAALDRHSGSFEIHLVGHGLDGLKGRILNKVSTSLDTTTMPRRVRRAYGEDERTKQLLTHADIVDVQWTEMMSVLLELQSSVASTSVLTAHDVLQQRENRRRQEAPPWRMLTRLLCDLQLKRAATREPKYIAAASHVSTLSEKDADLLREAGTLTPVSAMAPPLWDDDLATFQRSRTAPVVVMVAAFNRPENHKGAMWFLRRVWPEVLRLHPDATFRMVGAKPSTALLREANRSARTEVLGYVESLEETYATAAVAVVPLLSGAGIKFKSIDAILRGVPLVATSVGAEGIVASGGRHPFEVHDNPLAFARSVRRAIVDPGAAIEAAQTAAWARHHYSRARYRQDLERLLSDVVNRTRSTGNLAPPKDHE